MKLKIHFLEEALRRAGPGISEAALKENTDLKVDKVTLQRELQQYRKTLVSAENELDKYRQQLAKAQEKTLQKHATEEQREEISRLRQTLHETEAKVESLEGQVRSMEDSEGGEQALRDEVNDLEMDLREKERLIETKDDELVRWLLITDLARDANTQGRTNSGMSSIEPTRKPTYLSMS